MQLQRIDPGYLCVAVTFKDGAERRYKSGWVIAKDAPEIDMLARFSVEECDEFVLPPYRREARRSP